MPRIAQTGVAKAAYADNIADNGVDFGHLLPRLAIGRNRGICTSCGLGFSGNTSFDRHQKLVKGEVVCTHPSKLGYVEKDGFWRNEPPRSF